MQQSIYIYDCKQLDNENEFKKLRYDLTRVSSLYWDELFNSEDVQLEGVFNSISVISSNGSNIIKDRLFITYGTISCMRARLVKVRESEIDSAVCHMFSSVGR